MICAGSINISGSDCYATYDLNHDDQLDIKEIDILSRDSSSPGIDVFVTAMGNRGQNADNVVSTYSLLSSETQERLLINCSAGSNSVFSFLRTLRESSVFDQNRAEQLEESAREFFGLPLAEMEIDTCYPLDGQCFSSASRADSPELPIMTAMP